MYAVVTLSGKIIKIRVNSSHECKIIVEGIHAKYRLYYEDS